MSSERDNRQRAAARARLEREMTARQEAARRRRSLQTRILSAVAAVLVVGAATWIIIAVSSGGDEPSGTASCNWPVTPVASESPSPSTSPTPSASPAVSASPTSPPTIQDLGTPPETVPNVGYQIVTFNTNLGAIKVEMNLAKTPCTAASMKFLADKGYYNNTGCHRLVTEINALQCGDPTGTGTGGTTYTVKDENLPTNKLPAYHAGDVAMANVGQPDSNGTQFFFVYGTTSLSADYSLWGRVVEGLDIIRLVGAAGEDGFYADSGGGHPNKPVTFTTVTVGPVTTSPTPTPPPSPGPTTSAPATTQPASPTAS